MTSPITIYDERGIERLRGTQRPPGGGSQPGAQRWLGPWTFNFDDPGLNVGVEFYTPTPGDLLIDMLVVPGGIDPDNPVPFDGTTPIGDIGYSTTYEPGGWSFFATYAVSAIGTGIDMTLTTSGVGTSRGWISDSDGRFLPSALADAGGPPGIPNFPPIGFVLATPLSFWVSRDGQSGGAAPGAMQGIVAVYLCVTTPAAPSP